MAMDLFKKMVDVKQSFHITLFNVCFTKLQEQHKSGATASITSFLKKGVSEAAKCIDIVPTNSLTVSKREADILTSQANFTRTLEKPFLKKKSGIDSFFAKISPSKETSVQKNNVHAGYLASRKRSLDGCSFDEIKEGSKKYKGDIGSSATYLADEHIDQDVFSQLPPDFQTEVMNERNFSSDQNSMLKDRSCQAGSRKVVTKRNCAETNIETKNAYSSGGSAEQVPTAESSRLNPEKHSRTDKDESDQLFCRSSENLNNSGGLSFASTNSNGPPSAEHSCEKMQSNLSFDQSEDGIVPPDIDPVVFRELPQEIRNELLRNWKSKQEFSFSPANRAKRAQPKKQTLFKYFKKK